MGLSETKAMDLLGMESLARVVEAKKHRRSYGSKSTCASAGWAKTRADRYQLCATPEYFRRHGIPASPQELAVHSYRFILGLRPKADTGHSAYRSFRMPLRNLRFTLSIWRTVNCLGRWVFVDSFCDDSDLRLPAPYWNNAM